MGRKLMGTSLNPRFLLCLSHFLFLFLSFLFLSLLISSPFFISLSVEFFFRIRSLFNLSNFPEFELTCHLFSSVSFLLLFIPTFVRQNMVNDVTRIEGEREGEEEKEKRRRERDRRKKEGEKEGVEERRKRKRRNRRKEKKVKFFFSLLIPIPSFRFLSSSFHNLSVTQTFLTLSSVLLPFLSLFFPFHDMKEP